LFRPVFGAGPDFFPQPRFSRQGTPRSSRFNSRRRWKLPIPRGGFNCPPVPPQTGWGRLGALLMSVCGCLARSCGRTSSRTKGTPGGTVAGGGPSRGKPGRGRTIETRHPNGVRPSKTSGDSGANVHERIAKKGGRTLASACSKARETRALMSFGFGIRLRHRVRFTSPHRGRRSIGRAKAKSGGGGRNSQRRGGGKP